MEEKQAIQRDASSVEFNLLAGLRAFLASQEAIEGLDPPMPPPPPIAARAKIETGESGTPPSESSQLELEIKERP